MVSVIGYFTAKEIVRQEETVICASHQRGEDCGTNRRHKQEIAAEDEFIVQRLVSMQSSGLVPLDDSLHSPRCRVSPQILFAVVL